MEMILDYHVEQVTETKGSVVYRGSQDGRENTVIIKVLKADRPSPSEIARFKQEYEQIRALDLEGLLKVHEVKDYAGSMALVLEDFDGIPLRDVLKSQRFDLTSLLRVAVEIARPLGQLHKHDLIHQDIRPHNILLNKRDIRVRISNFGVESQYTHEYDEIYDPFVIENKLAYVSPEQTGRMNRSIDYRTDLYSLGILLYEMAVGHVPFISIDPMEVIHSHIARRPEPPCHFNSEIPTVVSDIIMRLLLKAAEERYQNCVGLLADLQECLQQLETTGGIEPFELGRKDVSVKFQIPKKLFGREKETALLLSAFDRASQGGKEMLLVSGYPGVGKTSLINEVHKPIVARRGYFISGKYDQFRRDVPYSSIIQAFQGLINQLLGESKERIKAWKEVILEALGPNGKIITDVLPDVELIIGPQEEVPQLGPQETQNRFNMVFRGFTRVFARKQHPLVLFLDDLQWVDSASLRLLKNLITDSEIGFLLLIGAFRDNEVSSAHPLTELIEEIRKTGMEVNDISVKPLEVRHVGMLIADFLRCDEAYAAPLAQIVHRKTGGNPFFVNQFLKSLYEDGMLQLDPLSGWQWDIKKIGRMEVTDNVVELMADRISKLGGKTREIVEVCACVGAKAELNILSAILHTSVDDIVANLRRAINEDLLLFSGEDYVFFHDRIQEAAYSLIPADRKVSLHYQIGRLALEQTSSEELEERIFFIVNQLNTAEKLITDQDERYELARLNLLAGQKAKNSSAYHTADIHFRQGIRLLSPDAWEKEYDLALALHQEGGEVGYLLGDYESAERLLDQVLSKATSLMDKVKVYESKLDNYTSMFKYREALGYGIDGLRMLGFEMPREATPEIIVAEFAKAEESVKERQIENLINLPQMTSPEKIAVSRILTACAMPAYVGVPAYFALTQTQLVNYSLKEGNSPYAAWGYVMYGSLLIGKFNDIEQGYRFGRLGMRLLDKLDVRYLRPRTTCGYATFVNHWRNPLRTDLKLLIESYKGAFEVGDFLYAGMSLARHMTYIVHSGEVLDSILAKASKYHSAIRELHILRYIDSYEMLFQCVYNLMGNAEDVFVLKGVMWNEEEKIPHLVKANDVNALFIYHAACKLPLYYLHGAYESAIEAAEEGARYLTANPGHYTVAVHYFYYSLSMLADYVRADDGKKEGYLKLVDEHQQRLKEWAGYCPENFEHKHLLVEAEKSARLGDLAKAIALYDKAILLAGRNEFLQEEAIANELAAKFYLELGTAKAARGYMQQARYLYTRWGAKGKVADLESKYPELLPEHHKKKAVSADAKLDLTTVVHSLQAISTEIILERLLDQLMKIVLANAGAERGFFITLKGEELYVEAESRVEGGADSSVGHTIVKSVPAQEKKDDLMLSLVQYVNKTRKHIVLDNACEDGDYASDPYVVKRRPRSILCAPIIRQTKMAGILYLENNIAAGAFTPDRIEVLTLLSSQAAISIENANLVQNMVEQERLKQEMELGRQIQLSLLPQKTPVLSGYKIEGLMNPAQEIGGDYYDFIPISNDGDVDKMGIVIADATGKGVDAGMVMAITKSLIHSLCEQRLSTGEMVLKLNKHLCNLLNRQKFISLIYGECSGRDNIFRWSGAGHEYILVMRDSGSRVEEVMAGGTVLGVFNLKEDDIAERSITLEKGDKVILYTDGVTEAKNVRDELLTRQRLVDILKQAPQLPARGLLNHINQKIREHIGDASQFDDITLVVIERE
ncbi:MAG TPA: AAA family ATPase [Thermodesulfovibrionales bacterium]|nr:AAA family ATPase [Thermodesulfovibrionales bacterium]